MSEIRKKLDSITKALTKALPTQREAAHIGAIFCVIIAVLEEGLSPAFAALTLKALIMGALWCVVGGLIIRELFRCLVGGE